MDRTINELEDEYFKLVYGIDKIKKFDSLSFKNDDNSVNEDFIRYFVESSMKKKSIIEDFNSIVMEEYQECVKSNINYDCSYLEYYEGRLIQEIRNLKLKGIC